MNTDTLTIEQLRYPIGKFNKPEAFTPQLLTQYISELKTLPARLRDAVIQLTEAQLQTPYRPEGWTLKQVVHHLADSHMNALMRIKLALTEDAPTIKVYDEPGWANQADHRLPIESSLKMLEGLHQHIVALFESMDEEQWQKTYFHPATNQTYSMQYIAGMYAWHSNHHLAHITQTMRQWGL